MFRRTLKILFFSFLALTALFLLLVFLTVVSVVLAVAFFLSLLLTVVLMAGTALAFSFVFCIRVCMDAPVDVSGLGDSGSGCSVALCIPSGNRDFTDAA